MASKHSIFQPKFFSVLLASVILVPFLASCVLSLSNPPTPTPSGPTLPALVPGATSTPQSLVPLDTLTSVPPSLTPLNTQASVLPSATPQDTPTSTSIPPSATPQPIPTIASVPGTIAFALGTTAGVVQGTVQAGQVVNYTIQVGQSQAMILSIDSPYQDVFLGVIQPDGLVLAPASNKWTHWQWLSPEPGLYTIQVVGGASAESYTLTAKIAQQVNFATGTSSITLNGTTVNGYVFSYALKCQGNQTMTVSLNAPAGAATIDIFGMATGTLLGASAKATSGSVVLPQDQVYVVEVIPTNGQVVAYSLTVSVTSPTSGTAENIVFAQGTTAGVLQGTIQPGQIRTYTISVGQDVPMVVILESPYFDVTLGVFEPNGNVLAAPYHKWTRWQGLMPATQVYTIQVIAGATVEDYTLTVKLPVRINFAPGTGSVTVNGTTTNGYVFSYVLRCNGNQSMTASLNVPSTKAYLDVFGLNTGVLLSPTVKATSWTGVLPQYQDYIVEVVPNGGQLTSYTLTISVH
jgi:hypothetical protein